MKYKHLLFIFIGFSVIMGSCAQLGTPGGGDKDTTAPTINRAESSENRQVFFEKQDIILTFDEWIKVQNAANEIFVSPPLDYPPVVKERGKKVTFEFNEKETLRENTTYQINFGKAIKDITEGNPTENIVFLFSTGAVLDSLTIKGKVLDELTGKPLADIMVQLYDNLSDTSFTTLKPTYLARTQKDGSFRLDNLRADTFQIFALEDLNVSYTYDDISERVAYIDSLVVLTALSDTSGITLELFDEEDPTRLIQVTQDKKGLIKCLYQSTPNDIELIYLASDSIIFYNETDGDTIRIWHNDIKNDSSYFLIKYGETIDTIPNKKAREKINDTSLKLFSSKLEAFSGDSVELRFNRPLLTVYTDSIEITDTIKQLSIKGDTIIRNKLFITLDSMPVGQYDMQILPGTIEDLYGMKLTDTTQATVDVKSAEVLGSIMLNVEKTDSIPYILTLLQNKKTIKDYTILSPQRITVNKLPAGKYSISVIKDTNANGRWSSGNIKRKTRSEKIKEIKLEDLKSGWDLELTIDLNKEFNGTQSR